jgi:hypothetical protein
VISMLPIRRDPCLAVEDEFDFTKPGACFTGGGSSGGGSSAPSNTTSNNTDTVIQQAPAYDTQYISNLLGQAATSAAQPYQQFPGQQVAGFTPDQLASFGQIENLTGNGTGGAAATQGAAANNAAQSGANTANTIGNSAPYIQAAAAYNPAAAASPYLQASAATNTPQGISSYLNPYLQSDISGLETAAQQNWNEFTAPSINNSFIGAGQAGSGRNAQVIGQQANLADQSLAGQISAAQEAAYNTAGNQAASAASNLAGLGSTAGSTAASEAANLQNVGTGLGNLAATQSGAQGAAATNLANTANTVQNTGITGAAALQGVGQQQQALNQQNINTAMTNFQNQVNWPETQESFLNSIINGLPSTGTSTTQAGQTPATTSSAGAVSPLSTLAGSLIGAAGSGVKKGGLIQSYSMGGQVKGYAGDDGSFVTGDQSMSPEDMGFLALMSGGGNDSILPPPVAASPLPNIMPPSPLPAASSLAAQTQHAPINDAPISNALSGSTDLQSDPYSLSKATSGSQTPWPTVDPATQRNYQLLEMARGFLTPARSGAQALGNAIGNYADTGLEQSRWNAEQQQRALQWQSLDRYRQAQTQNTANRNETYAQRVSDQSDIGQQRADIAQQLADQKANAAAQRDNLQNGKWELRQATDGSWIKINSRTGDVVPVVTPGQQTRPTAPKQNPNTPLVGEVPTPQGAQPPAGVPTPDEIRQELLSRGVTPP